MTTCRWPGNLTVTDGVPCGPTNSTFPVVPCCNARDQCMTDNICYYTRSRAGGSGYYIAGCSASEAGGFTDPSLSLSTVCVNRCADQRYPDVIYTPETGQWSCCGSGEGNSSRGCDNPTGNTFRAGAPESLISYGPIPNTDTPSSGLSTGAKAGIGVGVGVGALIIIAAAALLFLQRRKRNTPTLPQEGVVEKKLDPVPAHGPTHPAELAQNGPGIQELPSRHQPVIQELPSGHQSVTQELPAENWARRW